MVRATSSDKPQRAHSLCFWVAQATNFTRTHHNNFVRINKLLEAFSDKSNKIRRINSRRGGKEKYFTWQHLLLSRVYVKKLQLLPTIDCPHWRKYCCSLATNLAQIGQVAGFICAPFSLSLSGPMYAASQQLLEPQQNDTLLRQQ